MRELLKRCRKGEEEAITILVRRFQARALDLAAALVRDNALAQDAVQEAFLTAIRQLDNLRDEAAFWGWLRQIVRTECCRILRRRKEVLRPEADEQPSDAPSPREHAQQADRRRIVRRALAALPPSSRHPMEMFYLDDLGCEEIGLRLGIPTGSIKRRLHEGRTRLRRLLLSYVPESLAFLAASTGVRRAMVVGAIEAQTGRVSGYLGGMQYDSERAVDGRGLLLEAMRSPDCELVLVDAGVDYPTIEFLMQQLRRDGRTALLPVGILARLDLLDKAKRVAADDGRAESFPYPYDAATAQWQVARVLRVAGGGVPSPAERRRQAATALEWLAQLAADPNQRYYDLRPAHAAVLQASNVPELSARAVAVLPYLGTGESQRTLVEVAARGATPMPTRVAAMAGLRQSIERHGLLLTSVGQRDVLDVLAATELNKTAAGLAADFGTPESQAALVDFASRDMASPAARLAAVEGFRRSLLRYGMLLGSARIHEQYSRFERFNQSGNKDVATRHVLRRILDCIEDPVAALPPVDRDAKL